MLTRKAVRWYTKSLFPHPATEILLLVMLLGTWYSLADAKKLGFYEFMVMVEAVFLPIYGMLIASHILRDRRVTLFELTLFNGPKNVFLGRLAATLVGLTIGVSSVAAVTYVRGYSWLVIPVLLKIPTYLAVITLLMVWLDTLGGIISFYITTSAIPMALFVLLTKPYQQSSAMAVLSYFLMPIGATVEFRKFPISIVGGYTATLIVFALMILLAYVGFKRKDFEPQ
ncbi:hypothetical protein [Thermococcus sp.]|uniref:hypothetical protein n=1 Tax=Thermococcus sp. TaxID=35749 RepID=UPI0025D70D16|nr:hypothetical protein [Thermococcus sp.]